MNPKSNWPLTSRKHHVPSANMCAHALRQTWIPICSARQNLPFTFLQNTVVTLTLSFTIVKPLWINERAFLLLFMFYQRYESELIMWFIIYHKIKQDSHVIGSYMINLSVNELTRSVRAVSESSFWLTVITLCLCA